MRHSPGRQHERPDSPQPVADSPRLSTRLLALLEEFEEGLRWASARDLRDVLCIVAAAWNDSVRRIPLPPRVRLEMHLADLGAHAVEESAWDVTLRAFEVLRMQKQCVYPADRRVVTSVRVKATETGYDVLVGSTKW